MVLSAVLLLLLPSALCTDRSVIRLDSRGPVLFRQNRVGRDLKPFIVNKFRTMRHGVGHEPTASSCSA